MHHGNPLRRRKQVLQPHRGGGKDCRDGQGALCRTAQPSVRLRGLRGMRDTQPLRGRNHRRHGEGCRNFRILIPYSTLKTPLHIPSLYARTY